MLFLLTPAFFFGTLFALISMSQQKVSTGHAWASKLFFWDSLGAMFGGCVFHFLLYTFSLAATFVLCGVLAGITGLVVLLRQVRLSKKVMVGVLGLVGLNLLPVCYYVAQLCHHKTPFLPDTIANYQLVIEKASPHALLHVLWQRVPSIHKLCFI